VIRPSGTSGSYARWCQHRENEDSGIDAWMLLTLRGSRVAEHKIFVSPRCLNATALHSARHWGIVPVRPNDLGATWGQLFDE
jgi:hypothetical protein